jgi:putative ABC transport system substrate-binding protein
LPHAADKATKAAAPEATEAATTASTRCMAGTPTYGYACGKLVQRVAEEKPMLGVRRRKFITLLGGAAVAWPLAARAQQRVIGVLMGVAENDSEAQARLGMFRLTLQQLGWIDGQNVRFAQRWAGADADRRRKYAVELISEAPDVILADSAPVTAALQAVTKTIPIVFGSGADPVAAGLVTHLARPGANVTGFSLTEPSLGGKWLDLLKELAPVASRVGIIHAPENPVRTQYSHAIDQVNARLKLELTILEAHGDAQISRDILEFGRAPHGALLVLPGASTSVHREAIIAGAMGAGLPAIYPFPHFVKSGGLMSYGADITDNFRKAASYVDRILRGERPSDLPAQQPTKFELAINLKTAKALGLDVPATLLARADEVIE